MESDATAPRVHDGESRGSLFLFGAAGIGIYVALKILDPTIAFPLRQISSSLATWLLNALSIQSTLEGTAITTGAFTFDVNPDCSGSTSLRIMLTLGALWFGMYPNLTLGRRLICLALAAPLAVFFNALRVTALVVLGDLGGVPVEGFPHELVGILSFVLAMGAIYLMTLLMAREPEVVNQLGPRAHAVILTLALGVCYAPVLAWPVIGAPALPIAIVHSAILMVGLGLLFFTRGGNVSGEEQVRSWFCVLCFACSLVVLMIGTATDVITLSSLSLIGILATVVLYLRGWRFALKAIPLYGAIFIGLPGMHFGWIRRLAGWTRGEGYSIPLAIEGGLVVALVGAFLLLTSFQGRRSKEGDRRVEKVPKSPSRFPRLAAVPGKVFIVAACLGILFQTYFNGQAAAFDRVHSLVIPHTIGTWVGVDREPTAGEIEQLGRERVISREYRRSGSAPVHMLVNSTGADRTRAHRPEECMTGLGWKVVETEIIEPREGSGATPLTRLNLLRGGENMEMRYWFADPEGEIYGNIADLRPVDVTRRLVGQRTDWRVFRVFGEPGTADLDEFVDLLVLSQRAQDVTPD